jgi:small-conductance mechanosensitive channel
MIDVKMNLLLGGAAALLVGVGLGLQQTFNDFFSGIILLFERSIDVDDIVNVNGLIGTVKRIGLRTSKIETRDNITVIVPNSKLVIDNVINWSHSTSLARFEIKVHVSFNSDTYLVKRILEDVASNCNRIEMNPFPFVRFIDFGQYALEFHLLFWSKELINIEDVKSEMRFEINRLFKEHDVEIPYPIQTLYHNTPNKL